MYTPYEVLEKRKSELEQIMTKELFDEINRRMGDKFKIFIKEIDKLNKYSPEEDISDAITSINNMIDHVKKIK